MLILPSENEHNQINVHTFFKGGHTEGDRERIRIRIRIAYYRESGRESKYYYISYLRSYEKVCI